MIAPIVKKTAIVEMVPTEAVPAQVASDDTPQNILDAFNEDLNVNAPAQITIKRADAEKLAQSKTVAVEPSFGQF